MSLWGYPWGAFCFTTAPGSTRRMRSAFQCFLTHASNSASSWWNAWSRKEIAWLDQDCNGNTALHHAAATGNCLITQAIIEQMRRYGLDIDKRNNRGETPLILAERLGHFWCAELLRVSGKASTKARDDVMFKNAEQWRYICTELTPLKLSSSFRLEKST